MTPTLKDAAQLLLDGSLAFADLEHVGMRVDVPYFERMVQQTDAEIANLNEQLRQDDFFIEWRKRYGVNTTLGSRSQLGKVLKSTGYKMETKRETGNLIVDGEALGHVKLPFVKKYLRVEKLKRLKGTYLKAILEEQLDGILHPSWNLNTVRTFRSSCSDINVQNQYKRDPEFAEIIRRGFIPRGPDYEFCEIDLETAEVRAATCYHHDPTMLAYVKDSTKDMHRDMAGEIFKVDMLAYEDKAMYKTLRHAAKNRFVFPEFYGDWYLSCAKALWAAIDENKMCSPDGVPLKKWLKWKKINELGACNPKMPAMPRTFEAHLRDVEDKFWHKRFPVYTKWKEQWWEQYQERGWFDMLSGFRVQGYLGKNDVINYPVQGFAFHWLLWSLIQLHRWLKKHKMKSRIIGEVHDSMLIDLHKKEKEAVLSKAHRIIEVNLPRHWPTIIVPVKIEVEIGDNWWEKRKVA